MKVKIQLRHPNATIPTRGSELAGGWDVTVTEIKDDGDKVTCMLGFSLRPPDNYKVTLVPRSNLTKHNWIMNNSPGLGDPDFLGEYRMVFTGIPDALGLITDFPYKVGDRIGQIYLEEIIPIEFEQVTFLEATKRGEGGFGSTGK